MKIILLAYAFAFMATFAACLGVTSPRVSGTAFRDCADCPTMIVVPAGEFVMGSPVSEDGRFEEEGQQHTVTIAHSFAVSRAPITRAQYEAFVRATDRDTASACASIDSGDWVSTSGLNWRNPGFEQGSDHPVVCISWEEAQDYVQWLSSKTAQRYRLLSEAEFEYVARAGAITAYPWGASGDNICAYANSFDLAAQRAHPDWPAANCDDGYAYTSPAEAFPPNAFGLYDATGNVFQWTEDCWVEGGYSGAPSDGSPRGNEGCSVRVIRGGSWLNSARGLRAAMRDRDPQQGRFSNLGFRVARAL